MSAMSDKIEEFLEPTIRLLVDHPNDVQVSTTISTKSVIVQIECNKNDLGKVIGKKGKTIASLQVITLAIKNTTFPNDPRRVNLEIIEEDVQQFRKIS